MGRPKKFCHHFAKTVNSLQKHTLFYGRKNEKCQMKNMIFLVFFLSKQKLWAHWGSWGSSYGYPQSMFYSRNKKNNVNPFKPHFFFYRKVGLRGQNYIDMFSWCLQTGIVSLMFETFQNRWWGRGIEVEGRTDATLKGKLKEKACFQMVILFPLQKF